MDSAITVKGQATIPKAIREHLRLKPGDRVKFFIHPDGTVVLLPMLPASSLRGMLRRPGQRPVTIEEMDEAVASGASKRDSRSKRR
ncbi:MAG: AbrB/MazE/SpoVT family DNA-binding domain-containing protein [Rhodospirillales bacterium]|nr:AbrB/MazE/SpoVT family DNA-binding domain-containing protein [Rhodospirillales bacterium]